MNEFFGPATTNVRKRDIETILSNFGQQRGAWKQCLYYVAHTRNSYVSMYCLTTLEVSIIVEYYQAVPFQLYRDSFFYVYLFMSEQGMVIRIKSSIRWRYFTVMVYMIHYYVFLYQLHHRTSSTSNGWASWQTREPRSGPPSIVSSWRTTRWPHTTSATSLSN